MNSYKRWYIGFFSVFLVTVISISSFNYIVDPLGAFGDNFLKMYGYDMLKNVRIGKISYLDKNYKNFDSYIIGGSKSGSLLPETLNKYYPDSHFYNLNIYGGRFLDYEKTIQYIVKNYKVKNIVFQISQLEADKPGTLNGNTNMLHGKLSDFPALFYLRMLLVNPTYSIDKLKEVKKWTPKYADTYFFNEKNGTYNRTSMEIEILNAPNKFFSNKEIFPDSMPYISNPVYNYNLEVLKRIIVFCKDKGVNLLVITSPTYKTELETYPVDQFAKYMKSIAGITDYWNFSGYNSVNMDKTNFYDKEHFREKVGDMMLARIFGDSSIKIPDDFGKYVTSKNSEEVINAATNKGTN